MVVKQTVLTYSQVELLTIKAQQNAQREVVESQVQANVKQQGMNQVEHNKDGHDWKEWTSDATEHDDNQDRHLQQMKQVNDKRHDEHEFL